MDTKRLLLGTTAIVGAGIFFASPAHAQLELTLSGYTEFGVVWADEEEVLGEDDNNFDFFMDNEVVFQAEGVDDATGITYGTQVELEVGTDDDPDFDTPDTSTDEVLLFFSGTFGRVELGQEDGAADVMMLGAASVAAGTGGIDSDLPNVLTEGEITDTGDETKVTYFTPRVAGFQAGASYVPDVDDIEDFIEAGVNFTGQFAGLDVGVAGVGSFTDGFADLDEDVSWAVGGTIGFAGFNVGASYGNDEAGALETEFITAGVGFGLGPANVSFNYERDEFDNAPADEAHLFVASADVGLMPGVILKGDVGYNTDEFDFDEVVDDDDDGGDAENTWAAVVTVQLNY